MCYLWWLIFLRWYSSISLLASVNFHSLRLTNIKEFPYGVRQNCYLLSVQVNEVDAKRSAQNYQGKVLAIQTATFICFLCLYVCNNRSYPFSNFYRIVKSCQRKARKRISILCMFIIEAELCLTFSLQQTSEIIKIIQRPSILNELQKESCNT